MGMLAWTMTIAGIGILGLPGVAKEKQPWFRFAVAVLSVANAVLGIVLFQV
jgi:hypothetical protein